VRDSQNEERDKRTLPLSEWSSADWVYRLPEEAPLGNYEVRATVAGQKSSVSGSFLVAAYRRPDFRVDANLAGESSLAGTKLKGVVTGRYLFGGPMGGRDVRWTYTRAPLATVPAIVTDAFPLDRYVFLDEEREDRGDRSRGQARRAGADRARPRHRSQVGTAVPVFAGRRSHRRVAADDRGPRFLPRRSRPLVCRPAASRLFRGRED